MVALKVMRNKFKLGRKVIKKAQYRNIVIPQLNESCTRVNEGRRMKVIASYVLSSLWFWCLLGWRLVEWLAVMWRKLLLVIFILSNPFLASATERDLFGEL